MKKLFYVGLMLVAVSCNSYKYGASGETTQSSSLTHEIVKSKIVKGETTQSEILTIFGSPNIITKNKSNKEVWSYSKMSVVKKGGHTSFLAGEKASVSTTTQSFDLIITFDDNDIVNDYSVISTKY